MGFEVNNSGVNISIKPYNNVSVGKTSFNNTLYTDVVDIDFSKFTPTLQRVDFTVSDEMPSLPPTIKDFFIGAGKLILSTGATVVNVAVSFVSGIVSFAGAVVDCAAVVVGAFASVPTLIYDAVVGLRTGNWSMSTTKAVWQKGIMPFVGKEFISSGVDYLYENTFLKDVDNAAFGWGKRDGTVCQISKGVGYYTGMIIATMVTCGAAGVAMGATSVSSAASTKVLGSITVKTLAQAGMGFAGSMGKNTQDNYNAVKQNKKDGEEVTMGEIFGSIRKASGTALIDGGIYFAAGAVGDQLKATKDVLDLYKLDLNPNSFKVLEWATKHKDGIVIGTKASKAYISEGYNCLFTGEQYDFFGATLDAGSTVIAELAAAKMSSILYKAPKDSSILNKVNDSKSEVAAVMNELGNEGFSSNADAINQATKISAKEVWLYALESGLAKGEEKAVKEVTSSVYDSGIDVANMIGGLLSE